jgi:phage baseplate assembly protein gpV
MGAERRSSPRYRVDLPAHLMVAEKSVEVQLRDVCRDAALVEAPLALAVGTEVYVAVELHWTGGPLELAGRVIRVDRVESGAHATAVLFRGVTPAVATQIELLLDEYKAGKH